MTMGDGELERQFRDCRSELEMCKGDRIMLEEIAGRYGVQRDRLAKELEAERSTKYCITCVSVLNALEAEKADHGKTLDAGEKAADMIDELRNAVVVATAEIARLQTPEGEADYFHAWQEAKRDLKNTSRDYSELRESYDRLFDEHTRLKESLNQSVHDYHHVNCIKVVHGPEGGHLHGPDDDSPYDVDGCRYCGRCHIAL